MSFAEYLIWKVGNKLADYALKEKELPESFNIEKPYLYKIHSFELGRNGIYVCEIEYSQGKTEDILYIFKDHIELGDVSYFFNEQRNILFDRDGATSPIIQKEYEKLINKLDIFLKKKKTKYDIYDIINQITPKLGGNKRIEYQYGMKCVHETIDGKKIVTFFKEDRLVLKTIDGKEVKIEEPIYNHVVGEKPDEKKEQIDREEAAKIFQEKTQASVIFATVFFILVGILIVISLIITQC